MRMSDVSGSSPVWLRRQEGKSMFVAVLLLLALAGGVFWFMTFGNDRLDFFNVSKEMREACMETQSEGRGEEAKFRELFGSRMKKHGYDFINVEENASVFSNVDGTITCKVTYVRTVNYPVVDRSKTLRYTYACRAPKDGKGCEEVDPKADPY